MHHKRAFPLFLVFSAPHAWLRHEMRAVIDGLLCYSPMNVFSIQ